MPVNDHTGQRMLVRDHTGQVMAVYVMDGGVPVLIEDGFYFSPTPTTIVNPQVGTTPSTATISCARTTTWNWSKTGAVAATATVASGGTATSITFSLVATAGTHQTASFTLTSPDIAGTWTINLDSDRSTS